MAWGTRARVSEIDFALLQSAAVWSPDKVGAERRRLLSREAQPADDWTPPSELVKEMIEREQNHGAGT